MNKERWKELREEGYKRGFILKMLIKIYFRNFKWSLLSCCYIIKRFKHKHVLGNNCKCIICRKEH